MTTGDITNNIRKLVRELKQVSYDVGTIDFDALTHGIPAAFLPVVHYAFLDFSHELASYLVKKNYDLYGRTDLRFVETVFKIMRQEFSYKPNLKKEQFLALGFAERKIILLTDIVKLCREKINSFAIKKKQRVSTSKSLRQIQVASSLRESDSSIETQDAVVSDQEIKNSKSTAAMEIDGAEDTSETTSGKAGFEKVSEYLPDQNIDVPLPKPGPFTLSETSMIATRLPQPCDSLIVTPLKDINRSSEENSEMESIPRKSRADVIDIEQTHPKAFKVVSHKVVGTEYSNLLQEYHETSESSPLLFDSGVRNGSQQTQKLIGNEISIRQQANEISTQNKTGTDDSQKFDCSCNCKANDVLLSTLQDQVQSLTQSIKDVVAINNDLSARVVLLETQCRLMVGKIETMTSEMENRDEDEKEEPNGKESFRPFKSVYGIEDHGFGLKQLRGNERMIEKYEYSPDKYADIEETVPPGFQPIRLVDSLDRASPVDTKHGSEESDASDNDGDVDVKDSTKQSSAQLHESPDVQNAPDAVQPVLSPLQNTEFSFMEEDTKATILNLQKRLEETMNMFKLSSKATK